MNQSHLAVDACLITSLYNLLLLSIAGPEKPIYHFPGIHELTVLFMSGTEILVQLVWIPVVALDRRAVDADPSRRRVLVVEVVASALDVGAAGIDAWRDA